MPVWIRNYVKVLIAACLVISFCLVEGDAQTRRKKKRARRAAPAAPKPVITNPTIAPPDSAKTPAQNGDVKIISTDDPTQPKESSSDTLQGWKPKATAPEATPPSEEQETQSTIKNLTNQVNRLNDKLTSMQEDDRYQLDMERLTRAEQRAEQLRGQLMDIQSKIADFESNSTNNLQSEILNLQSITSVPSPFLFSLHYQTNRPSTYNAPTTNTAT